MRDIVVVGALWISIGCFHGALAGHPAVEPGSLVVKALIERTGVSAYVVDEAILGQVLIAGAGQNPTGQSATKGGLPSSVSAITTNDVCGPGLEALHLATQVMQCGETDIAIAGGQENMSRAPHVLTDSCTGAQLGSSQLVDSPVHNGLRDALNDYHTGVAVENLAREHGISRQLQDAHAFSSQQEARAAIDAGRSKDEIVPVITRSNGQTLVADTDEQPRTDISAEALARLNPSFDSLSSVTAGNASSVNDGITVVMIMSETKAWALDLPVLIHIRAFASVGMDPALMGVALVYATHRYLERVSQQLTNVDPIEVNGALATQTLSVGKMLEWSERRTNVNGGVIALGHPIGTSGRRVLVSLVHEVVKRNARKGLATLCISGGQGVALTTERDEQLCILSLPINICCH